MNGVAVFDFDGQGCEREVREATNSGNEGLKKECLMRLSWALVHSHQQDDVQRGIDMLEGKLATTTTILSSSFLQTMTCYAS